MLKYIYLSIINKIKSIYILISVKNSILICGYLWWFGIFFSYLPQYFHILGEIKNIFTIIGLVLFVICGLILFFNSKRNNAKIKGFFKIKIGIYLLLFTVLLFIIQRINKNLFSNSLDNLLVIILFLSAGLYFFYGLNQLVNFLSELKDNKLNEKQFHEAVDDIKDDLEIYLSMKSFCIDVVKTSTILAPLIYLIITFKF